jgi:hypothetical protein
MTVAAQKPAETPGGRVIFPFYISYVLKNLGQKSGHRLLLLGNPSAWRARDEQEHVRLGALAHGQ